MDMDTPRDAADLARELRHAVRRIAKIPTAVGLGPTKTVAKVANAVAKGDPALDGVCDLRDERERMRLYERTAVDEVWGIGGRTAEKLRGLGITTVARFIAMPPREVRSLLTVVGARVQAELQGVSCLPLFGKPLQEMSMSAAAFTQTAGTPGPSPLPALPSSGRRQQGDLPRAVLACLASGQRQRSEIGRAVGCTPRSVHKTLARLERAGAVVAVGGGCYRAAPGAPARIADPGRLSRMIVVALAAPRRISELTRHTGAPRSTVKGQVDTLVSTGQVARIDPRLYVATGRPRAVPVVPAAPPPVPARRQPQPIRDAILAFLGEPRQAVEVAAHIGRSLLCTTSHLATMRRLGLAVRIAHGRYERADPLPDLARPAAVFVPSPIRQAILAHLSEPRRLKEVAAHIGRSTCSVYSHLDELRRRGLVARTGRGRYQRATATPGQAVAEIRPAGPA